MRGKAGNVGLGMFTGGLATKSIVIIESYDKNLALHEQKELEPKVDGDKAEYDDLFYLGDQLYEFFTLVDKKSDETNLYYQIIDKKTLLLSGTPKKVASISYDRKRDQGYFEYDISKDKKNDCHHWCSSL